MRCSFVVIQLFPRSSYVQIVVSGMLKMMFEDTSPTFVLMHHIIATGATLLTAGKKQPPATDIHPRYPAL